MTLILGKSLEYSNSLTRMVTSTYKIGSSPLLLNDFIKKIKISELRFLYQVNSRAFGFLHSFDFKKILFTRPLIIKNILRNSRKIFPYNSYQIKSLEFGKTTDDVIQTLLECNPFGLVDLKIGNCIELDDDMIYKIFEIKSLRKLEICKFIYFFEPKYVSNLEHLIISTYDTFSVDLKDKFPFLETLHIFQEEPDELSDPGARFLNFDGGAKNLKTFILSDFDFLKNHTDLNNVLKLELENMTEISRLGFFNNLIELDCINCDFLYDFNFDSLPSLRILGIMNYEIESLVQNKSFPKNFDLVRIRATMGFTEISEEFKCKTLHIIIDRDPEFFVLISVKDSSFEKLIAECEYNEIKINGKPMEEYLSDGEKSPKEIEVIPIKA